MTTNPTDTAARTHLFTAREAGYRHCRVPSCVVSPGGVAMAFTEARIHPGEGSPQQHNDYWNIDVLMRRSDDAGLTWDGPQVVVGHRDYGGGPIHNFVPIADPFEKCVHALFMQGYRRLFYIRSDDEGRTWTRPREITQVAEAIRGRYAWTAFAVGPGHGLCKQRGPSLGRLIVPAWMCAATPGAGDPHRPSDLTLLYSDDHGQAWQAGPTVAAHEQLSQDGIAIGTPNETTVAELSDGSVMFNSRNESSPFRRVTSGSPDGITHLSIPRFDPHLIDAQCHASLLVVPSHDAHDLLVFTHPDSLDRDLPGSTARARDRKNLTAKLSRDAGRSWQTLQVIEPGPSGYSDLALLPDGRVLCVFECGMINNMYDTRHIAAAVFPVRGEDD